MSLQAPPGRGTFDARKHTNKLALSKPEAAEALGVSVDALEEHVMPSLRVVKVGRRLVIPVRELERWLDAHGAVYGSVER